jgi:hypothetical protein
MRYEKICISNDPKDNELADTVARSLTRLGLEIFYPNRNVNIESTRYDIKDSNCFITIITKNSRGFQPMKQELDIALADIDLEVFPLIERGEKFEPSDFITYVTEFDRNNIEDAIYRLISVLREYLDRFHAIIKGVFVICSRCGYIYRVGMPSQKNIDKLISENEVYSTKCMCGTMNNLNSKTFEVLKS